MTLYNPQQLTFSLGNQAFEKDDEHLRCEFLSVEHEANFALIADASKVVDTHSLSVRLRIPALIGVNLG
jgi:hypothetical protein